MIKDKFAIFITSHGSPNKCATLDSLLACGYTGQFYLVLDDLDTTRNMYNSDYNIIIFNKMQYVHMLDTGIASSNPQLAAVLYARAFVEDYAKEVGLDYFMVMDDDLTGFRIRFPYDNKLGSYNVFDMDSILNKYIEYMDSTAINCLSFANDGSFIGGLETFYSGKLLERRSCHTVFLRDTHKPFDWSFAVNEDYISSLRQAITGSVMFTLPFVQRNITGMNNRSEGMHEVYETTSDFQRAFYATLARPDVCKPKFYKGRFVIGVDKKGAYPKIISSKYKRR